MMFRWIGALLFTTIVAVVLAFVLPAHPGAAGSLEAFDGLCQFFQIGAGNSRSR